MKRRKPRAPRYSHDAFEGLIYLSRQLQLMPAETLAQHPEIKPAMEYLADHDHPKTLEAIRERRRVAKLRAAEHVKAAKQGAPLLPPAERKARQLAGLTRPINRRVVAPRRTQEREVSLVALGELLTTWGAAWTEHVSIRPAWRYLVELGVYLRAIGRLKVDPPLPPGVAPPPVPAAGTLRAGTVGSAPPKVPTRVLMVGNEEGG